MKPLRKVFVAVLVAVVILASAGVGFFVATQRSGPITTESAQIPESMPPVASQDLGSGVQKDATAERSAGSTTPEPQQVIRTASISVRVKAIPEALTAARRIAGDMGGTVESMSYDAKEPDVSQRTTQAEGVSVPGEASIVLRIPSAKLDLATDRAGKLGAVLSQTAGEQDVTQQAVDLDARLKNLRAEEARLRSFLARANKIADMLAIENELTRVRGEIESLQAQRDYLKAHVAMATLTIQLSEPVPIVSPTGTDWGIAAAVTRGVRAAASIIGITLTLIVALTPVALVVALVFAVRWLVTRRRTRRDGSESPDRAE